MLLYSVFNCLKLTTDGQPVEAEEARSEGLKREQVLGDGEKAPIRNI